MTQKTASDEALMEKIIAVGTKEFEGENRHEMFHILSSTVWHRKHCDGDCNVSLHVLGRAYSKLAGRKLTKDEQDIFRGIR